MPDTLTIVLDNGHGGDNEGLNYRGYVEKDMTLVVANAMKDELEKYENVQVYITNPNKENMSLKKRAEYAKDVGADVMICLHFNMSEEHTMYGAEAWVPSTGLYNSKMHALGDVFMEEFSDMGLTIRGVKTRLNDKGQDYYGIIRESKELGIPTVLVEHCHADYDRDYPYMEKEENWISFGQRDATAVAKYYGLHSESLGVDYKDYVKNGYYAPEEAIPSDLTPPENAQILLSGKDGENFLFTIRAKEEQSSIVYYDYSIDGGKTFSELFPFTQGAEEMVISVPDITYGSQVLARIYNGHFVESQTNVLSFAELPDEVVAAIADREQKLAEIEKQKLLAASEQEITEGEEVDITTNAGHEGMRIWGVFSIFFAIMLLLTGYITCKELRKKKWKEEHLRLKKRKMLRLQRILYSLGIFVAVVGIALLTILPGLIQDPSVKTVSMREGAESSGENAMEGEIASAEESIPEIVMPDVSLTDEAKTENDTLMTNFEKRKDVPTTVVYDIAEGYLRVPLLENVAKNKLTMQEFAGADLNMRYSGTGVKGTKLGVDVSKFQGDIDWNAVKEAGVSFAIMRLGIRGYGSGSLQTDEKFYVNLQGAQSAGLETGVYFFSAAINEEEAVEEAEYVLNAISGYDMTIPIVFDTEPIFYDTARTDNLTPMELTKITRAFCERIKQAGYEPMIYSNAKRFTTVLHLEELSEYKRWLADYRQAPDFPYDIAMWQFTEKGSVPGISGSVDIDMMFEY